MKGVGWVEEKKSDNIMKESVHTTLVQNVIIASSSYMGSSRGSSSSRAAAAEIWATAICHHGSCRYIPEADANSSYTMDSELTYTHSVHDGCCCCRERERERERERARERARKRERERARERERTATVSMSEDERVEFLL